MNGQRGGRILGGGRRRGRAASWLLCGACLFALGCPPAKAPPLPPPPLQVLAAGASVVVEFPPDGQWYGSGYAVTAGQRLVFDPQDSAAELARGALQVHVGRTLTQIVTAGRPVESTRGGEVAFRLDPSAGYAGEGPVRVRITNATSRAARPGDLEPPTPTE